MSFPDFFGALKWLTPYHMKLYSPYTHTRRYPYSLSLWFNRMLNMNRYQSVLIKYFSVCWFNVHHHWCLCLPLGRIGLNWKWLYNWITLRHSHTHTHTYIHVCLPACLSIKQTARYRQLFYGQPFRLATNTKAVIEWKIRVASQKFDSATHLPSLLLLLLLSTSLAILISNSK